MISYYYYCHYCHCCYCYIIIIMCICCFFTYHMVLLSMAILLIVCLLLLLLLLLPLILLLWLYMCIRFFFIFFCTYVYDDISKQIFRLPSTQNFTAGTGRLPGLLLPGERWGNSDSPQWELDLHGFNQPEMGISSGISWFTNPENIKTYTDSISRMVVRWWFGCP